MVEVAKLTCNHGIRISQSAIYVVKVVFFYKMSFKITLIVAMKELIVALWNEFCGGNLTWLLFVSQFYPEVLKAIMSDCCSNYANHFRKQTKTKFSASLMQYQSIFFSRFISLTIDLPTTNSFARCGMVY